MNDLRECNRARFSWQAIFLFDIRLPLLRVRRLGGIHGAFMQGGKELPFARFLVRDIGPRIAAGSRRMAGKPKDLGFAFPDGTALKDLFYVSALWTMNDLIEATSN
ncbi:MAG TPA: hypothetical protein VK463_09550 [Desulfomonilaceae bacterium]|nr:hypothetical protein [Desulfomonilaceae bacterium]